MRISKIDGSGDLGDEIVKVVQGKSVIQTESTAPEIPSAPPTGSTQQSQPQSTENDAKPTSAAEKGDQNP